MSLLSLIRRAPKRLSLAVAIVAAAIIVPAATFAWGPDRETFTIEHPASYPTFNSITNNPSHGDERNFVLVKEAGASDATYTDDQTLTPGKEYTFYVYYHNNAASNLNASGVGIAHDVVMKAEIPALVKAKTNDTKAVGYINASNTTPKSVWDHVNLDNTTTGDIALRMVPSSAKIHNFGATNGRTLSDTIVSTGVKLGFDDLNGDLKGCNEFAGYVTFNLKAEQANFDVSKQVRLSGTTEWKENVTAKVGTTVDYLVTYKNTGTTTQNDVVIKDTLPKGLSYVTGSTKLANGSNPSGVAVSDKIVQASGINIGNYGAGSNAFVMFSAKVNESSTYTCGVNTLRNVAVVETNNGAKQDTADVTLNKDECKPDECKPGIPVGDKRCIDECKPGIPVNDKRCEDTPPVTPPELPHTGATENIVAIVGLGALIASIVYYVASRRALNQ